MIPSDVPIHRPSVGAMAVTTGSQMPARVDKPYIYRGTGEDENPATKDWGGEPKAVATAKAKAKPKRRRRKPRRRPEPRYRPRRLDIGEPSTWAYREPPPKSKPPLPLPEVGEDDPEPPRFQKPIRPSPGWKPMTGADIEALFDELGED